MRIRLSYFTFLGAVFGLLFLMMLTLRVAEFAYFQDALNSSGLARRTFLLGAGRDLFAAVLMVLPLVFVSLFLALWPKAANRFVSGVARVFVYFLTLALAFLHGADYIFFPLNERRLGFEVFTQGVSDVIPVLHAGLFEAPVLFGFTLLLSLFLALLLYLLSLEVRGKFKENLFVPALLGLCLILSLPFLFFSVEERTQEPLYEELQWNLVLKLAKNRLEFNRLSRWMPEEAALSRLRKLFGLGKSSVNPFRRAAMLKPTGRVAKIQNIVLIVLEGVHGGDLVKEKMPALFKAKNSALSFENFYANGLRTRNGLVALLTGWPDIVDYSALKTHAAFHAYSSLPRILKRQDYRSYFLYGGDPDFETYRRFLKGLGLESILGREQLKARYPGREQNAFGRSFHDDVLLEETAALLNRVPAQKKFILALGLSTHSPFLLPDSAGTLEPGAGKYEEYLRTLRFTDTALGDFLERRRRDSWGKNTLVIITADHTHHLRLKNLERFRVPFLMMGPGFAPGVNKRVGSHVDLLPTLFAMFGKGAPIYAAGTDLLANPPEAEPFAFMNGGAFVLWRKGCEYFRLNRGNERLFSHVVPGAENCVPDRDLANSELRAYFQITRNYMLRNKVIP